MDKQKTNKKKIIIAPLILVLIVLYVIIFTIPDLTGALTKTTVLQYENWQVMHDTTCYFVRDEKVFIAPNSGKINYYLEEGTKVRKNTKVLDIVPSGASSAEESKYSDIITRLGSSEVVLRQVSTGVNGVVSYFVDGYEAYFTPENIKSFDKKKIEEMNQKLINLVRENTFSGEPIFKISDNQKWYMVCFVEAADVIKYEVGNKVTVNLPLGQVKATVDEIVKKEDEWLVSMECTRYYEEFAKNRLEEATIITSDYNGVVIDNHSITTKDGAVGVYVKSKSGEFGFVPLKIISSDGKRSLVAEKKFYDAEGKEVLTVNVYDEILRKPKES